MEMYKVVLCQSWNFSTCYRSPFHLITHYLSQVAGHHRSGPRIWRLQLDGVWSAVAEAEAIFERRAPRSGQATEEGGHWRYGLTVYCVRRDL